MRVMSNEKSSNYKISKQIDIRGKVCPLTFVYTKLALEDLEKNSILEVLLDFQAALENIPDNCKRQNIAELMEVKEVPSIKREWKIFLKKL